jgi:ABC-2 type transport system permease protein
MNVGAVVRRIMKQFIRDKRSLALLIVAPILIMTLIWLVLDVNEYHPKIAVDNIPPQVEEKLQDVLENELQSMSKEEAEKAFEEGELDAFLSLDQKGLYVLLEGSDSTANRAVIQALQSVISNEAVSIKPTIEYYYGTNDLNLFDQVGSVLIGFFVFFFVFIIGGISFLRERTQGTLEKLLSTPIKRWEIVVGYLIGFGIFTIIQSIIIVTYAVYVLDIYLAGDFWTLLVITFLLAIMALSLATLLSAYANNEFQMFQFIPLVIVPQVFFSGIFNLETMDKWLQVFSKFMPLTYGADAMQQVMIKGMNIWDIWLDIMAIIAFAIVFILLNILALKKHRRL